MAYYGRMWRKYLHYKDFSTFYYGWPRLARVYGLWFTRERSKVRSLVRPPAFARFASFGSASRTHEFEAKRAKAVAPKPVGAKADWPARFASFGSAGPCPQTSAAAAPPNQKHRKQPHAQ